MNLFALFSLFLSLSIDHGSPLLRICSWALLGKTDPENARAPPIRKATPVSRSAILEKKPDPTKPAMDEPERTMAPKKMAFIAQTTKLPIKSQVVHVRKDRCGIGFNS